MKFISFILFSLLISIPGRAQKSSIQFTIAKDTVLHGEVYENDVSATLVPGDSLLSYEVYIWDYRIPIKQNIAQVKFVAIFSSGYHTNVIEKNYSLVIKFKTLKVDTLINTKITYVVKSNPAAIHKLNDESLHDAEVFPEVPPRLYNYKGGIKDVLLSTLLLDQADTSLFSSYSQPSTMNQLIGSKRNDLFR